MNTFIFLSSFLLLYTLFGRKIAVPWGVLVYHNVYTVVAAVFLLELFQIHFFYSLYDRGITKIPLFKKLRYHLFERMSRENQKNKLFRWAKKFGWQGVFLVSALPSFGGGVLTATVLVTLLKLNRKISYLVILFGGVLCNLFLAVGTRGILNLIRVLF